MTIAEYTVTIDLGPIEYTETMYAETHEQACRFTVDHFAGSLTTASGSKVEIDREAMLELTSAEHEGGVV